MDVMERIKQAVDCNPVVIFMKGTPQQPMCGFSAKTVAALDSVEEWRIAFVIRYVNGETGHVESL